MNKNITLIILLFSLVFLCSCEDMERLKRINNVAVVDLVMDVRIGELDRDGRRVNLDTVFEASGETVVRDDEKDFFDRFSERFFEKLNNKNKITFRQIYDEEVPAKIQANKPYHYRPYGYIDLAILNNKKDVLKICEKLGVDALATVKIKFYIDNYQPNKWELESDPFQPKRRSSLYWRSRVIDTRPTTLQMVGEVIVVDKEGIEVINRQIIVWENTRNIQVSSDDVVDFDMSRSELFYRVSGLFLEEVGKLLR